MNSALQKRLLLALESGRKLHDALSEPGMPSQQTVQHWQLIPAFAADFIAAAAAGKLRREAATGKVEASPVLPAAAAPVAPPIAARQPKVSKKKKPRPGKHKSRPQLPGPATVHGTLEDDKRRELSGWLTKIIGDGDIYVTPPGRQPSHQGPAPVALPFTPPTMATRLSESEIKQTALDLLREGTASSKVLKSVRGLSGLKLAAWRKDVIFAAEWDKAKAMGKQKQPARVEPARVEAAPIEMSTMAVSLVATPVAVEVQAHPLLGLMPKWLWQERVRQERVAALRESITSCLDFGQSLPPEWVEEYNQLILPLPAAA